MQKTEKEILNEVKRIEFSVRKLMSGISLGVKNSTFRGQGMTFSDIRAYTPGDDIRNFAWQVMARTGEPFVKEFEEERDLEVHVALDIGASMQFGGLKKTKAVIQAYVLAFLGLSTAKSKDKFGGVIFSNRQVKRIPVKRGDDHVRRTLYSFLEESKKTKKVASNANIALEYFAKIKSKNCICVLVSDFTTPLDRKLLARVKSKHQVQIVFINDPYERKFPNVGLVAGAGIKSPGLLTWFLGNRKNNLKLSSEFEKKKNTIEKISKAFGILFVSQSTHDDELREITKALQLRRTYG